MRFLFVLSVMASSIAYAQNPVRKSGEIDVSIFSMMEAPKRIGDQPTFSEVRSGYLFIRGDAAQLLWDEMTKQDVVPAVPNLDKLPPSRVSLGMLERRIGNSIACHKVPESNGDEWVRDAQGKMVFNLNCSIAFEDARDASFTKLN